MSYYIKFIDEDGQFRYRTPDGISPYGDGLFPYYTREAAVKSAWAFLGYGPAFWESERESREAARQRYKGWTFEVFEGEDL